MGRKLTHDYVENYFKERGCELLSEYVNKRTKASYRCSCGNIALITFNDFSCGKRCGCRSRLDWDKKRRDFNEVKKVFSDAGCELLEESYKNNHTPMRYRCRCGRTSKISFSSFRCGRRCFECGKDKNRKPHVGIKRRYKSILRTVLLSTGQRKSAKTAQMLGYSVEQLWRRITTHSNWDKVKDQKWHLDHIFPITAFIEHGIVDVGIINALDNLQPLSAGDNIRKSNKYDKKEFKLWLGRRNDLLQACQLE